MPSTVADLEARAKRLEMPAQPYRYRRPGLLAFLAGAAWATQAPPAKPRGNREQRRKGKR